MKTAVNSVIYAFWLIKEIFVAGFSLAMESFKPKNNYHPVVCLLYTSDAADE